MAHWIRFENGGKTGFGTVEGETIAVHSGDMFAAAKPTGETLKLSDVRVSTPCQPSKMICLWNNFHQLAAKNDFQQPNEPLWFLKAPNAYRPAGRPIQRPATYAGKIIYEGELGVVIGKKCFNISEAEAGDYIFGYTCVNDVTAVDLLRKDKSFEQWARAKSFDTFGVFGPVIATDVDPMKLSVKTILNGKERQNYPVADMFFPPHKLVAAISKDVTLMPGDIIACGTSLGAGTMGDAHNVVDIVIDGVGSLSNVFDQVLPSPYLLGAPPRQKRICVVGAGAIGGLLAARFALAGEDVTVIDQGAHLAAIQKNGLKLEWHDGNVHIARMKAVNKPAEAGKQDIVVLAVKAHFLDQVVRDIDSLLAPDTVVLTVQNGLPWWYFGRHPPRRRRPLPDRRTRRQRDRARQGIARRFYQGRTEITGVARYPFGDLAQGVGQSLVQPDLGADPCYASGHLPVRGDARTGRHHDEGSAGHRGETRRHLPRHHRQAHRRC